MLGLGSRLSFLCEVQIPRGVQGKPIGRTQLHRASSCRSVAGGTGLSERANESGDRTRDIHLRRVRVRVGYGS